MLITKAKLDVHAFYLVLCKFVDMTEKANRKWYIYTGLRFYDWYRHHHAGVNKIPNVDPQGNIANITLAAIADGYRTDGSLFIRQRCRIHRGQGKPVDHERSIVFFIFQVIVLIRLD